MFDLHRARGSARGARVVLLMALVVLGPSPAAAQERPDELTISYLWDGGAVPFLWGSLGAMVAIEVWGEPPDEPRWFSPDEGGKESRIARELPGMVVTAGAGVVGVGIALSDAPTRWYHVKGFAQSVATTGLLTSAGKVIFGRHRPDFDPLVPSRSSRSSFPSGHSSGTLAVVTYTALYLRWHGFERYRHDRWLPWWEGATYAGLAAIALAVPVERIHHHRHHVTDAIAGAAIGATSSLMFFAWQQWRSRRDAIGERPSLQLAPTIDGLGDGLGVELAGAF